MPERPDFLQPLKSQPHHNSRVKYYQSWNPLGHIYRMAGKIEYEVPEVMDNDELYWRVHEQHYRTLDTLKAYTFAQDMMQL